MKVVVLGSSSKGNSTFVEINGIKFLIDVGFSFKYISDKLIEINEEVKNLDFIIITHAHSDHINSLYTFYRLNIPIYIGIDTYKEVKIKDKVKDVIFVDELDNIMGIKIDKIPISHDAVGYGYTFEYLDDSLCYIADTGLIYTKFLDKMRNKKIYLMESNHDVEMEMNGSKDFQTKLRNIGDTGHLSNEDCAKYLNMIIGNNTKKIVLIHISEHDNTYEKAYETNRKAIDNKIDIKTAYANEITIVN